MDFKVSGFVYVRFVVAWGNDHLLYQVQLMWMSAETMEKSCLHMDPEALLRTTDKEEGSCSIIMLLVLHFSTILLPIGFLSLYC